MTIRRKIAHLAGVAGCCALAAGCFGGGGDDPAPTPTPTGTPTPSPTPSPTSTPTFTDFDFTKAFADDVINGSYIFAYFTPTGGAEVWSDGSRVSGSSAITYKVAPESALSTWPDGTTLKTFGAGDLQTSTPTLRTYRNGTDKLTLELPFRHVLRASYEKVDNFVRESVAGTLRSNRVTLFFNEVSTTVAIAANLTYTGVAQVVGGKPGSAPVAYTSPPTTCTVTASDKKIACSIQIVESVGGTATVRAVLPISATIGTGEGFSGTIDDTANGFKGTYGGALAGPNREEVLIIFNVAHTDGREFIGSYIGD